MNDLELDVPRLTDSLVAAAELVRRARRRERVALPALEAGHLDLLAALEREPQRITSLATQLGEELSTVSRRITRLVRLGLVAKTAGQGDRRVQLAELTEQGAQALATARRERERLVAELFGDWSHEDLHRLEQLATRIGEQLADQSGD